MKRTVLIRATITTNPDRRVAINEVDLGVFRRRDAIFVSLDDHGFRVIRQHRANPSYPVGCPSAMTAVALQTTFRLRFEHFHLALQLIVLVAEFLKRFMF